MSWKYEIKVCGDPKFYQNSVVLATKEEAEKAGRNKHWNWTQAEEYRVVEVDEPVNYKWVDGEGIVSVEEAIVPLECINPQVDNETGELVVSWKEAQK
jgi:hypothetical protein